jgi:hypothetical protein
MIFTPASPRPAEVQLTIGVKEEDRPFEAYSDSGWPDVGMTGVQDWFGDPGLPDDWPM